MGDPSGYELPGFLSVHTALQDPMLEERHLFFGIWFNCSGEELFCYPQLISSQHRRNHFCGFRNAQSLPCETN
ncbi:hypothetical protein Y1Q_0000539 [Alligator mississippiensis]|uniref:Uncharacterized protein n=1 Tax=Alligator mississippiensis TaxID=8496 RepID=A0A151MBK7_ALLMI|nr:hypothetical protein Y1Q_0000539 [Alligator mississippiensis]